jgi:hypothetical protein
MDPDKRVFVSIYCNSLKAKEAELRVQLETLGKERSKITDQYCRDKIQVAVTLSDKLFKNIFQGEVAEQFANLTAMVLEVAATDPKAEARLAGDKDGYGLKGGPPQDYFVQFVWPAIVSSRGLSTILERSFRHSDNPYLAKRTVVEPRAPAKEGKKNV